jgi:hypothetical protein
MNEADLIRREDVMPAFEAASDKYNENKDGRWFRHHMADAIAAIPPAPDVARLVASTRRLLVMIDALKAESGRAIDYGEEDAFRMGEWFDKEEDAHIEEARAALAAWDSKK